MVFKRKASFFLDLGAEGGSAAPQPATIAMRAAEPEPAKAAASQPKAQAAAAPAAAPAAASDQARLTTAEAIAAELRAAQEALPPPSTATFAPESLNPANALPRRRRRAGANLAGFKAMGASLVRS